MTSSRTSSNPCALHRVVLSSKRISELESTFPYIRYSGYNPLGVSRLNEVFVPKSLIDRPQATSPLNLERKPTQEERENKGDTKIPSTEKESGYETQTHRLEEQERALEGVGMQFGKLRSCHSKL